MLVVCGSLLFVDDCLLSADGCLLFVVRWLFAVCCLHFFQKDKKRCVLFDVFCCLVFVAVNCLMFVVVRCLFVVRCSLCVGCCLSCVVCRVLFVVCCCCVLFVV